jgi:hypothetical protein
MKIKKPNETKVIQEAEIPLGTMAGAKSFGKCGAHIVTPKKWTNGKTNLTVLAISAMLVLSYFTMSYQGPAFATIGGARGGGGSNFDRGDGGGSNFDRGDGGGSNFDRGDGGGSNFDRGDGGGDGGNSGGLPNINDDFDDDFDISHNHDIDDDLNIDDDFDIDHEYDINHNYDIDDDLNIDDDFDIDHNYDIDDDLNIDDDFDIDHEYDINHNYDIDDDFDNDYHDDHYTKTVVVHDSDNTEDTIIVNTNLQGTCFVTQSQVEDIPGIIEQLSNQCTSVTILQQ